MTRNRLIERNEITVGFTHRGASLSQACFLKRKTESETHTNCKGINNQGVKSLIIFIAINLTKNESKRSNF